MSAKVKCSECAFLAVRDEYNDAVCEATEDCRTRGQHKSSTGGATAANFFCYRKSASFIKYHPAPETDGIHRIRNNPRLERAQALKQEIECLLFQEYVPGRSPQQVEQQLVESQQTQIQADMLALQKEVHDWEQKQAAENQKFEQRLAAIDELHHQESLEPAWSEARGTNWQAWWSFAAFMVAIAALIVSIIALQGP